MYICKYISYIVRSLLYPFRIQLQNASTDMSMAMRLSGTLAVALETGATRTLTQYGIPMPRKTSKQVRITIQQATHSKEILPDLLCGVASV